MSLIISSMSTLFLACCEIYAWHVIEQKKVNLKDYKLYLGILIMTSCGLFNYTYMNNYIKGICMVIINIVSCKLVMNQTFKNSIILSFLWELSVIIIEAIYVLILVFVLDLNMITISSSLPITFLADIVIGLAIILLSHLKIINKLYKFIQNITKFIRIYQVILFLAFTIMGSSVIITSTYFQNNIKTVLLLNLVVSLLYIVIVLMVFNYQNRYNNIRLKYNMRIESLHAQEILINDCRIINHENKNQLLIIKSMTKNKRIISYINTLIDQKKKFNNEIIDSTLKLPEGGIRGLIYTKILYMKEKNINCCLNVDKKITSKLLNNINDKDIVDICQVLGVFIDNSIDEVIINKHKEIVIDVFFEAKDLIITISNYNSNKAVLNGTTLKSTKGNNRGYGLQLVKQIIDDNDKLTNERIISKNTFKQKLKINLKKNQSRDLYKRQYLTFL